MTAVLDYAPPVSTSKGEWMTRAEAAEALGVSLQTVDRYVSRGVIASRKNELTNRVRLAAADVEKVRRERAEA
jgi:excisionase family DNA binding protein